MWKSLQRSLPGILLACLIGLHLLPIWANTWFVTLDGPCHLYNAHILLDLLRGDPTMGAFFRINAFPEPYWSGQLFMAGLFTVLPAAGVEKIVFSVIVLGTGWAFQRICRTLDPERGPWAALLVAPFLLHYAVLLGFINFSFSLPLLLCCVDHTLHRGAGRRAWAVGIGLFTLLYFTHLSTFLLAVAACTLLIGLELITHWAQRWTTMKRRAVPLTIAITPGLLLTGWYISTHGTIDARTAHLPLTDLLAYLPQGRAWNALGVPGERAATTWMAVPMLALGLVALYRALAQRTDRSLFLACMTGGLFTAYLVLPDVVAGGSSASPRLLLFLMLFLALLIVAARVPACLLAGALLLVLGADMVHLRQQFHAVRSLSGEVSMLMEVASAVPQSAVVHPLRYDDNWMHSNINNYVGVVRDAVMLDNFVATAPFAPVQWRAEMDPATVLGDRNISDAPCLSLNTYGARTGQAVDLVLTWHLPEAPVDSCARSIQEQLATAFRETARSEHGQAVLYSRR